MIEEIENIKSNYIAEARELIVDFEEFLSTQGQEITGKEVFFGDTEYCKLEHFFGDDIYMRQISIPKGVILTGKIHRKNHPNVLLKGKVAVFTEGAGFEILEAPMAMISKEGTKRIVETIEDTIWLTFHNVGEERDLKVIEEMVIAPSYNELEQNKIKHLTT